MNKRLHKQVKDLHLGKRCIVWSLISVRQLKKSMKQLSF